ncbi:MAG: Methyltransferase type 11 [Parcubacteria group bacterium GW2011_GWB1_43_8]|nr:MAG: Methyltransferase type 11 [Parcubacteria group bacterium GW2011_GWB1_43_8]
MFIKPEEIIKNFEVRPGMVVADFGSGSGHYVLAMAKKMNNSGLPAGQVGVVYAIDIQKNLLEKIKSEAVKQHLSNVDIVWADIEGKEGTKLANGILDFAVASNILFQIGDKEVLAKEIKRTLKSGGRVAVIDWAASFGGSGPAPKAVVVKKEAERIFIQEGFLEEREFPAGDNHYGIIFKKP